MLDGMRWRYRLAEARALLQAERELLLKGATKGLAALEARRKAVVAGLEGMPAPATSAQRAAVREIGEAARRNQRLLRAYLDGAADAARRLRAIDESRAQIGAYRQDGTRLPGVAPAPTTERRA